MTSSRFESSLIVGWRVRPVNIERDLTVLLQRLRRRRACAEESFERVGPGVAKRTFGSERHFRFLSCGKSDMVGDCDMKGE